MPNFSSSDKYADMALSEVRAHLGPIMDEAVSHLTGKDGGYRVEKEADGHYMVERRFTEHVGSAYHAHTWAWDVRVGDHPEDGKPYVVDVLPANTPTRTLYIRVLDRM